VPHLLVAMLGLSGLMHVGATVFEVVRWAGVAYLTWMGISMIRDRGSLSIGRETESEPHRSSWSVVRQAVLLNLLNPKLTAFFFAFLPQFVDTPSGSFDLTILGLSGMFMAMTLAVFVVYAYASAVARERLLGAPRVLKWLHRSFGAIVIGFAAKLALTDR
jgi:threonine/homoserine/homoserine lactone efflux protein